VREREHCVARDRVWGRAGRFGRLSTRHSTAADSLPIQPLPPLSMRTACRLLRVTAVARPSTKPARATPARAAAPTRLLSIAAPGA